MSRTKILELGLKNILAISLIVTAVQYTLCQESTTVKLLEFKYGFQAPLSDMNTRFGGNNDIGVSFQSASLTKTIFAGVEGIFFFGSNVKEDVIRNLRTFDGNIIGIDGLPGDVNLKERGFYLGIDAGKIFKTSKQKDNLTGIRTQIGVGLLQHKIRVQDNLNTIPALLGDYLKGYDRLSNGPTIHLAAGFQYQNPSNNLHFIITGEIYGGKTVSRRDFDTLTGGYLSTKRTDILAGVSITYVVTISKTNKADQIYY